jgi:formate dehydrogenase alpha subunit
MDTFEATLNGSKVGARPGMTILELAEEAGVKIPTLCHHQDLSPLGACRICVVEVESSRTLVGACYTPVTPGMVIETHSPTVVRTRRTLVEMMFASHGGSCIVCDQANRCEFRRLAMELDVGLPTIPARRRFYPLNDTSPYVRRDLTKCILCRRCVRVCDEVVGAGVFGTAYRGFNSKICVDSDTPLDKEICRECLACIEHCPTGALLRPRELGEAKGGLGHFLSDRTEAALG